MTRPVRAVGLEGLHDPGRTVAICGRWLEQRIVAMMLPPKAGRVCSRSPVSGSMARPVQSAVRPQLAMHGDARDQGPAPGRRAADQDSGLYVSDQPHQGAGFGPRR
jgi:hypothetical protein